MINKNTALAVKRLGCLFGTDMRVVQVTKLYIFIQFNTFIPAPTFKINTITGAYHAFFLI